MSAPSFTDEETEVPHSRDCGGCRPLSWRAEPGFPRDPPAMQAPALSSTAPCSPNRAAPSRNNHLPSRTQWPHVSLWTVPIACGVGSNCSKRVSGEI